jgi:hypothetical protein
VGVSRAQAWKSTSASGRAKLAISAATAPSPARRASKRLKSRNRSGCLSASRSAATSDKWA